MLVEEGFQVVSVDASDKMLKYALKERWKRRKEPEFDNSSKPFTFHRSWYEFTQLWMYMIEYTENEMFRAIEINYIAVLCYVQL